MKEKKEGGMKGRKGKRTPAKPLIGFIGQGFIGKSYADDFERRGYAVVRYSMEEPYRGNKEKIKECDIVFVAVPTPTTPKGYDCSIVKDVLALVGKGKTAVIKSTLLPGTTEKLQRLYPDRFVFHSPEFLTARTAAHDAMHPDRNIVGIPVQNAAAKEKARLVLSILPQAAYEALLTSREAEFVKYGGNCWFYFKVLFVNMLYDLALQQGVDYAQVRDAMAADPRIGRTHLDPVHESGRGAGGLCFIKDFRAFRLLYEKEIGDTLGIGVLDALEKKNIDLLVSSGKDLGLLAGVYGDKISSTKSETRNKFKARSLKI